VSRALTVRSTDVRPVFFSDHCLLLADLHLEGNQMAGTGSWKLNAQFLTPEKLEELKGDDHCWRTVRPYFESPSLWWEAVKGRIKEFFIRKRVQKARERRGEMSRLHKSMQNLLHLQSLGVDVKEDLQEVKSQQASLFTSEASKVIFRSRVRSVEQDETCSSFFFQKVQRDLCDQQPEGRGRLCKVIAV